ncbi:MAG: sulfatase-like hydrolase/transferase [Planctomycetes bacterium]|nr:sulfatase-like hydrolase/transferase [Planctomycetota bacterium]
MRTSLVIASLLTAPLVHAAEPAKKPNVVFLFADDMRADTIAALGNPVAKTPNLDAIVTRGFAMSNAYCFGGNSAAVCTPSRNMLLSGNAYFRWKDFTPPGMAKAPKGLLAPGDAPNFPLTMRDAGYLTYHHGKRANTAPLIQAKFEVNKYLKNDDAERKSGEPGKEIVDEAIEFLKGNKDTRPVFMYLAFANPHDPRVADKKYLDLYNPDKLPLPKNFLPIHPFDNGDLVVRDEQLLPWPRTEADVRRTLHEYYATVTALDFHIGRFIQSLKDAGQLDNTIIIFSADQGIAVGSHGLLGKQNLYDHSMKSPLVFAGPGIPKGKSDALVHLFDIYPTVCELVGAKSPEKIDGVSFRSVIDGKAKVARPELMLAYLGKQRAIRDDRWKLIRYPQLDVTQLFDLQSDPEETKNLAADPTQKERVADLLQRLAKLQKHYDDELPLTVANPKPATPVTPEQLRLLAKPGKK